MESLLEADGDPRYAFAVAQGFLRSGDSLKAIQLLIARHDRFRDPQLAHLLADSFFTVGDYHNAALAYAGWIDTGCTGYLYSPQEAVPWIIKKGTSACSQLPVALRSRLEMLQEVTNGNPANLPAENLPPGQLTAH